MLVTRIQGAGYPDSYVRLRTIGALGLIVGLSVGLLALYAILTILGSIVALNYATAFVALCVMGGTMVLGEHLLITLFLERSLSA